MSKGVPETVVHLLEFQIKSIDCISEAGTATYLKCQCWGYIGRLKILL